MSVMNSKQVIKILQINLNHCWAAQQLLVQTVVERSKDILPTVGRFPKRLLPSVR